MKTKQTLLSSAVLIGCAGFSLQAHAVLPPAPVLNFDAGVQTCNTYGACFVKEGSYFGMDTNGSGSVTPNERTPLVENDGLELGTAQPASGSHSGAPDGTETPGIDAAWSFFGNTGLHFTSSATDVLSSSGNTATIDLAGWRVTWNGIAAINMGAGAWAGNANGVANITCAVDCAIGDTYTLDYSATVPLGDPSGFGGVAYQLQLVGTITSREAHNAYPFSVSQETNTTKTINFQERLSAYQSISDTQLDTTNIAIITDNSCGGGTIINNDDGTVVLPACTTSYTFTYTVADTDGNPSQIETVAVYVSATPAPDVIDDSATANGTTPVTVDVAANDSDDDGTLNLASIVIRGDGPGNGTVDVDTTSGAVTYTANANFTGIDSFRYTIEDDDPQASAEATVYITVNAFNTPSTSATFVVGATAATAGSTSGIISLENIGVADTNTPPEDRIAQSCIGGCFDFELRDLTPGATGSIVLPLSTPVPTRADPGNTITYRKLINGTWRTFDRSTGDTFRTAPGTRTADGVSCPQPSSDEYTGLTAGHNCLLLNISDGGPNDDDGLANGTVVDPGGLAEITRVTGTDGCSMTGVNRKANDHADWWLLSAFIGLLGWFSLRRKQA